jgi:hypothetical protein
MSKYDIYVIADSVNCSAIQNTKNEWYIFEDLGMDLPVFTGTAYATLMYLRGRLAQKQYQYPVPKEKLKTILRPLLDSIQDYQIGSYVATEILGLVADVAVDDWDSFSGSVHVLVTKGEELRLTQDQQVLIDELDNWHTLFIHNKENAPNAD